MTAGVWVSLRRRCLHLIAPPLLPDRWWRDSGQGWVTLNSQPAQPFSSFSCKGTEAEGLGGPGGRERRAKVEPEQT